MTTVSGSQSEPRWTPLLSYKPASGTAGSATMRRPRYAGPDGWPAGSVTLKPAGDEKSRPVASATSSALVNVASTCDELSKRLLSASSTWTWKLPGSAPPRFCTVKLTGTVSPAAAMSTPVRNELPVKSGSSGADVVRLHVQGIKPRRVTGDAAASDRRIVVVVGGAADADVVGAGGRRLKASVAGRPPAGCRAPAACRSHRKHAGGLPEPLPACWASMLASSVSPCCSVTRVEIDLVGNGQEVRHLRIVERAEVQRHSQTPAARRQAGCAARANPRPAARTTTGDAV